MEIKKIDRQGHSLSLSKDELWDIYKSMKTQRILEDRLLKMYKGGQLSGAVYPGIGQELQWQVLQQAWKIKMSLEEHIEILESKLKEESLLKKLH